jgi:hypothetical protein
MSVLQVLIAETCRAWCAFLCMSFSLCMVWTAHCSRMIEMHVLHYILPAYAVYAASPAMACMSRTGPVQGIRACVQCVDGPHSFMPLTVYVAVPAVV